MIRIYDQPCPICDHRHSSLIDMPAGTALAKQIGPTLWWVTCHHCGYSSPARASRKQAELHWRMAPMHFTRRKPARAPLMTSPICRVTA